MNIDPKILNFCDIKSVFEELTARGSCTGVVTVGPTCMDMRYANIST